MGLIALNQQTPFTSPSNGDTPMDATTVKANDNSVVTKHNAHDADATIHVQTGLLASRPAASTPYAMYVDENKRLYVANGSVWAEVPYARLDAAGTNAFTNNVTVGGTLQVTGVTTTNNISALAVSATAVTCSSVTATTLAGNGAGITGLSVPAANVVAGSLGAGAFTVAGTLTATTFSGSGASLTAIPQSGVAALVTDLAGKSATTHTHTAFASAVTLSSGGAAALTISNSGGVSFPASASAPAMTFGSNTGYLDSGAQTPLTLGQAPVVGAIWYWLRVEAPRGTGWIPVLMAV